MTWDPDLSELLLSNQAGAAFSHPGMQQGHTTEPFRTGAPTTLFNSYAGPS